ncbi:probable glutathione S-transferase 8 [Paramacrobiotus metropolitanus]|uniref:probable glutathione S-transferase 8 n=1 Tax=Paramacrobiotus metropolitanus TaxID=2943436 RepID=UPI00244620C6|nr:probable glutathione S-transferase 8 [Paramacrobiotus metropolitanus]
MNSKYRLNYFNAKGSGEVIRWIFAYAGVEYEDNRLDPVTEWPAVKHRAPYGKLPFLEVDGKVLGESYAIQRFLAKRFGLAGSSAWEEAEVDALADYIAEVKRKQPNWVAAAVFVQEDELGKGPANHASREDSLREDYLRESVSVLKRLENMLQNNSKKFYFVGEKPSWADFVVTRFLDGLLQFDQAVLNRYPLLSAHRQHIRNLHGINHWLQKRPDTVY